MSLQEIVKKEYVENDNTLCFETTSVVKVIILSTVTCGVYDIILTMNYWKSLKENFGYEISPFWRGLFEMFTNFKLFPIFAKYFDNFNIKLIGAGWLAAIYFLCTWLDNKMTFKDIEYALVISTVLELITALIFALIQSKINKINKQYYPDAPKNPWSVANTIWTLFCSALLILGYIYS